MSKNLILESFLLFSIPPSVFLRHHNKYFLLPQHFFSPPFPFFLPQQPFFSHHAIHLFPSRNPFIPITNTIISHLSSPPHFSTKFYPFPQTLKYFLPHSIPFFCLNPKHPLIASFRLLCKSSAIITQKH